MSWIKNHSNYRNPKIYATNSDSSDGIYLSKKNITLLFAGIILLVLIWFVFVSDYFKVREIIINGSLNADVQGEIESFRGKNILTFVLNNTEKQLMNKQSSIKKIAILRGLPDTLKIDITVREPVISWKTQDKTLLIDDTGVVFEQEEGQVVDEQGKKIPLVVDTRNSPVELGIQIVTKDFVSFIDELVKSANNNYEIEIGDIEVHETTFQVEANTNQGYKVKLDSNRDVKTQLEVLKNIVDQYRDDIHEYIDLRVEGRVYYK